MNIFYKTLFLLLISSCIYGEGDYGATVDDCDEICTVYYVAQRKIMEQFDIYDKNFPDEELRRKHVKRIDDGLNIKSWFYSIDDMNDSVLMKFSCDVYLDLKSDLGYLVRNLKVQK